MLERFLGDLRGRALWVVLGCFVCQLGLGFGYVFGPLAGDIIGEFEWTRAAYSSARAPQLFVLAGASPLVGLLVIRFGARWVLAFASALLGVAFLLFSQMQGLTHMTLLVMAMGLAISGLGDITVAQAVNSWIVKGRGLALGIVFTGSNFGGWLLVPIAVGIADDTSWRDALSVMGGGALLLMLPVAILAVRRPRSGEVAPALDAGSPSSSSAGGTDSDLTGTQSLRTRSFWILAAALFTFFFYFLGMLESLVLFLTDEGVSRNEATFYFSTAIGLGMVSKIALGLLADRIPHRSAIQLDYGILAFSSFALLLLPGPAPVMWIFVGTYGFSVAARDVVYPLIINHCFGVRYMAQIYGMLMLALIPGGALGPIYAAAIHDHFGSYDLAFQSFAALNSAAVVGLFLLRDERRPTETS